MGAKRGSSDGVAARAGGQATPTRRTAAHVGMTAAERAEMEREASRLGLASVAEYLRHLHRERLARSQPQAAAKPAASNGTIRSYHQTALGTVLCGDALDHLATAPPRSVDLVMTSPPFGLVRKKSYGNEDAHRYCEWFRPFAAGFRRVLKDRGSLVIDIGGAWKPGQPTRSLYHFELLLMLCEEYGFHLCQEHYWWNPAKLPTPAEWVNIRRVRVKDAVNCVWWLSPTPWPKASNRRVLAPYSESMRGLLKHGYKAKLRPSGHQISTKFAKDNGGAVPPNLLAVANTESTGHYQEYCREHGLPVHPARFPKALPEYFIRMVTDPGDMVLDPFAGSCVTGAVAERLGRRWTCCELDEDYLKGAMARFQPQPASGDLVTPSMGTKATYAIHAPCSVPAEEADVPLVQDGGARRPAAFARRKRS